MNVASATLGGDLPVVLVHGNPETSAIWGPLVEQFATAQMSEPTLLSPPGFGAPRPSNWDATVGNYRLWLIDELEKIGRPVRLVGHDWGGAHVVNVVMTRPDLVHSWVSDSLGLFHPDYVWHPRAATWQTPDVGERAVADLIASSLDERAGLLSSNGMDPAVATRIAPDINEAMAECIPVLYRSAMQPVMADLGSGLAAATKRPGLAIIATDDVSVGTIDQRTESAHRAGAEIATLDDQGHWWMTTAPELAFATLADFWSEPQPPRSGDRTSGVQ